MTIENLPFIPKAVGIIILAVITLIILACFIRTLFSKKRTFFTNLFSIIFAAGIGFILALYFFAPDTFNIGWNWFNKIFNIV